jgi:hypothetical protein
MGGNAAQVGTCTATEQFHSLSVVERETKAPAPRNLLSTRRSRSGETTSLGRGGHRRSHKTPTELIQWTSKQTGVKPSKKSHENDASAKIKNVK